MRRRLAGRVALAATASGAFAGVLAAVFAVVLVDRMVSTQADRRLSGAADVLVGEIEEGFEEGEWEPLAEIVADENLELVTSGVRLAVFSDGHRIAGDPWVPGPTAEGCELHGVVGRRIRTCSRAHGDWMLVAATESEVGALRAIYASAALAALLLGGLGGALASRRLTRWALRPLSDLGRGVRQIRPGEELPGALRRPFDVEEVELIRDALASLLDRLGSLLGQSRRFAADAAHELRMPLTTIRGEIDLLIEDAPGDEREALGRIERRLRDLSALIERLLVLAVPVDTSRTRFEAVALADVIDDVVGRLQPEWRQRVRLDLQAEGTVYGDETLLAAMLSNAIDNALKFSSGAVEVELAEEKEAGSAPDGAGTSRESQVVVEVRDTGDGVPVELRERVFDPFFRARADATPGQGLGLSLIAHIARAHRGVVGFVPGDGSRLRFVLPAWRPEARSGHD